MGNQYVKTFSLAKAGNFLGKASFGVGVVLDGIGVVYYLQDPNNPNAVSPAKFGVNTGIGAIGLTGWGTAPALIYFGLEAFYPGGTVGAFNDVSKAGPIQNQLLRESHF